ncbi:MAG: ATP-binding protein [Cyanobacteria bacterium J06626_14]
MVAETKQSAFDNTDITGTIRLPLILASVLIVVIPVAINTIISVVNSLNFASTGAFEQLAAIITLTDAELEDWLNTNQESVTTMLDDPNISWVLPASGFPGLSGDASLRLENHFSDFVGDNNDFDAIFLLDEAGFVHLSTEASLLNTTLVDRDAQPNVWLEDTIMPPVEVDNTRVVAFLHPIFNSDGSILAILGAYADMRRVSDLIQFDIATGSTREAYLVNSRFDKIASSRIDEGVIDQTGVETDATTSVFDEQTDFRGVYENAEANTVLGEATYIPELDSVLVVEIERAEAFALATQTLTNSVLLILVFVVLVIFVGVWFARRRILRPLDALIEASREISGGKLDTMASVDSQDEFHALALTFNDMTSQLKNSINTLEERVQERTVDLVAARDEAQRANDAKTAFLASTSHELRTPLNAVINYARLISSGHWGAVTPEQSQALDTISKNGRYLLNLINDLLDMSKIVSGSLEIYRSDVDLNLEIEEVIKIGEGLDKNEDVEFITEVAPDLPSLYGDGVRIRQIMINMVSNAFKFTEVGHIRLVASTEDDRFVFKVEDTGMGIQPDDYDAVFASFQQTESGIRKGKGTGLGMSISKNLAEQHDGELWFESTYGKGTTFYLALPIHTESALAAGAGVESNA